MKDYEGLAAELFAVAQVSPKDNGFSDTIERIENWLREKFPEESTQLDEGWISNVGNDTYTWPDGYGVTRLTRIEVKLHNGDISEGDAEDWESSWKETDGGSYDIVAFRILK